MRKLQEKRGSTKKAQALSTVLREIGIDRRPVEDVEAEPVAEAPGPECMFESQRTCVRCTGKGGLMTTTGPEGHLTALVCRHYQDCKKCNGSGFYEDTSKQFPVMVACSTHRLHDSAKRVRGARVPNRFATARWDWYNHRLGMKERMAPIHGWMDAGMPGGLWLGGNPGTGKTMMSALIALRGVADGKHALWMSLPDLLAKTRERFDDRDKRGPTPMRQALDFDLLVLDDVDKLRLNNGKFTEWVDEQLWQLIKEREEREQPTVFTSNTPVQTWCGQSRNGAPLLSRIRGRFLVVNVSGKDARLDDRVQNLFG